MTRSLLFALLLTTTAASAHGQATGGPPIAYVKSSNSGSEIYLANEDGTGRVLAYKGSGKTSVTFIDLRPGGGEVAFSESLKLIKLQGLASAGWPTGTARTITAACSAWAPDYHPSGDGSLIFISGCSGSTFDVWRTDAGGVNPRPWFRVPGGNRVRWSRTGTYVYYQEEVPYNSGILRLRRWEVSTGNVSDFGTLTALDSFDITHDGEKLVYGSLLAPKLFNFETMADTSESIALCDNGRNFHYSPTGSNFVYRRGANGGEFVVTSRSDCQGGPTSVTGKGSWGYLDWRPDPVTGP